MKPIYTKIITTVIILLGGLYLFGLFSENEWVKSYARAIVIPVFVLFYFLKSRRKNLFFGGFLSFLAIAEISKVYFGFEYEVFCFITNIFSIIAYLLLVFYIHSNINLLKLLKEYWVQSILLVSFCVYILINLNGIMFLGKDYDVFSYKFIIENTYNFVVMWLMCIAFLNFLYLDNKRTLLIFIISLFFGLAEIVQVPYLFLSAKSSLHIGYSMLYFMAYYFVYIYITTRYNKQYHILS